MLELAHEPGSASTDEFEVAGTGRVFRGYTAPVPEVDGGLRGRIWTLREVTADRELDRMRDAFVATVSHELRTPLTSISGFLEMMQDEEAELGASRPPVPRGDPAQHDRLHALVEDLLLMAQIEAKRIELSLAPVDVQALASRSIEATRPAATEKGVALELVSDHPPTVIADGDRIAQVIDNLVSNAVKFTNEGGSVTRARRRRRRRPAAHGRRHRASASRARSTARSSRASSAPRLRPGTRFRAPGLGLRSRVR